MRLFVISFFVLQSGFLFSQSKKELSYKVDSLIQILINERSQNYQKVVELTTQQKIVEQKIQENQASIESLTKELNQQKSQNASLNTQLSKKMEEINTANKSINEIKETISAQEKHIMILNDSLAKIGNSLTNDDGQEQGIRVESKDFLNKYFFDQIPLNNHVFKLSLNKIIIGDVVKTNRDYYNYEKKLNSVYVPEIVNPDQFEIYKIKSNKKIEDVSEFKDILEEVDLNYFSSFFPKIEILKNKLVTLTFHDDTEENFLLNVEQNGMNNFRKTYQIKLANEEIKEAYQYNEKDMMWTLLSIDNESYIALDYNQLTRIKIPLMVSGQIEYIDKYNRNHTQGTFWQFNDNGVLKDNRSSGCWDCSTYSTSNKIYLARKMDNYMDNSQFVDPNNLIFLFKFEE